MSGRPSREQRPGRSIKAMEQVGADLLRRVPPHDLEAEQAVLGAVFVRQGVIGRLSESLRVGDFYSPVHQDVFSAFHALYSRRQPIDPVTVGDELGRAGKLEAVGGPVYLAQLVSATVSAANAEHHARIIREKARRQGMLALGASFMDRGFDQSADPSLFAAIVSETLASVLDESPDSLEQMFREILDDFFGHLARLQEGAPYYIPTPIHKLNGPLVGLAPGELVIVAGRPGNGKAALTVNMLVHAACQGFPAGIASLEMGKLPADHHCGDAKRQAGPGNHQHGHGRGDRGVGVAACVAIRHAGCSRPTAPHPMTAAMPPLCSPHAVSAGNGVQSTQQPPTRRQGDGD